MSDRLAIIEARQLLLMRAFRGEFSSAPLGEFEARWNATDPSAPAPTFRLVRFLTCECEDCRKAYADSVERPVQPNPLDGGLRDAS